jgi:hypothetical protein
VKIGPEEYGYPFMNVIIAGNSLFNQTKGEMKTAEDILTEYEAHVLVGLIPYYSPEQVLEMMQNYADQSALNRDKVTIEDYRKFITTTRLRMIHDKEGELFTIKDVEEMITGAICSLSLPTLNEGEIDNKLDSLDEHYVYDYAGGSSRYIPDFEVRAWLKELTKPKEEER